MTEMEMKIAELQTKKVEKKSMRMKMIISKVLQPERS